MKRAWRFWPALWLGKLAMILLKLLGKKGTTFPGRLALQLDSQLIRHLGMNYSEGVIIVTGTNGKTTTANLLASILENSGKKFSFNQAGANLVTGISGALLKDSRWGGSSKAKLALLEVDEATVPKLCEQLTPNMAIITNFFRDQLDRYGELDTTIGLVRKALPEETLLILNADDPLVAQFGCGHDKVLYYGIEKTPQSKEESLETRESKFCPVCGTELSYSLFHYGQLGHYQCFSCGFKRPLPQVLAREVSGEEEQLTFRVDGPKENSWSRYSVALQGYYNLYNALGALAAGRCLGIEEEAIQNGLKKFQAQPGRMELFSLPEGQVTLTLVKNPTGFNQVIHTLLGAEQPLRLMIVINDQAADGRDISWLWDVDFERLFENVERVSEVICSGLRAEDMALRLKYAGIGADKLLIEHDFSKAVRYLQKRRSNREKIFILPTYTALFPLRDVLKMYREAERRLGNA